MEIKKIRIKKAAPLKIKKRPKKIKVQKSVKTMKKAAPKKLYSSSRNVA